LLFAQQADKLSAPGGWHCSPDQERTGGGRQGLLHLIGRRRMHLREGFTGERRGDRKAASLDCIGWDAEIEQQGFEIVNEGCCHASGVA